MNDVEFRAAFEQCTLSYEQWDHRAHVRIAFLIASHYEIDQATDQIRARIQAYNKATNTPESLHRGYHETITRAFMRLVYAANLRSGPHACSDEFCRAHPELLSKHALQDFYSAERLMSFRAKQIYVEPDRCPLPFIADRRTTITCTLQDADLVEARRLFAEYADSLDVDLSYQGFDEEVENLPGAYSRPSGSLWLAWVGDRAVGCVALRPMRNRVVEMKRLWVSPSSRGTGIGRSLACMAIQDARCMGYQAVRLDTLPSMRGALSLYTKLGFTETAPYATSPVQGTMFMQLELTDSQH